MNVTICYDVFDVKSWETSENVNDINEFLLSHFDVMPTNARLYVDYVSDSTDVTPRTEADIQKLAELSGRHNFFLLLYPEDPVTIGIIVAIGLAAISIGLSFLLRPSLPSQSSSSPNNQLGDRQNKPRPNERIPEIVGTVRSTPDDLIKPYRIFNSEGEEQEHAFSCVGVGAYTFNDMRDDLTPINDIDGAYVGVYGPNKSPNNTTIADLIFSPTGAIPSGTTLPKVLTVQASTAINGQTLFAPNQNYINANNNIAFGVGGTILSNDSSIDFTQYFQPSNFTTNVIRYLQLQNTLASDPLGQVHSVSLDGIYEILDVTSSQITLSNPTSVNSNWNVLSIFQGGQSTYQYQFTISAIGDEWQGPYILDSANIAEVWLNYVCPNGLYYIDNKGRQGALTATLTVGVQAIDNNNNPIGSEIQQSITITGSSKLQKTVGATLKFTLPSVGSIQVRSKRSDLVPTDTRNNYVNTVQWRDMFAVSPVNQNHFGNVTTLQSITIPTTDATSIKSRKLNCEVTRNLPQRIGSTNAFTSNLYPTNSFADIVCFLALDSTVGRRTIAELDVAGIYQAAADITSYFGTELMQEYCYTFDDNKTSFEEMLAQIGQSVNCTFYRRGNILSAFFEKQTSNATLLFNHRNKVPDSEQRDTIFGTLNDNDGIEYEYIDPLAPNSPNVEQKLTLYFPEDQSATNAKKISSTGVRNLVQAKLNGWRLYQKLMNQNTTVQMEVTQEGMLCIVNQPILISDNTRPNTQDGEIQSQTALLLSANKDITFEPSKTYSAFFQLTDASLQSIPITAGPLTNQFILSQAPRLPLVTDPMKFGRTKFEIVGSDDTRQRMFLVSEKSAQTGLTVKLTAVNYSDEYYSHDKDFINGLVSINSTSFVRQPF